jgi:hypothetical protein
MENLQQQKKEQSRILSKQMVRTGFLISENCIMRNFRMYTFIWVITPSRMRWEGHVVHMGAGEKHREY